MTLLRISVSHADEPDQIRVHLTTSSPLTPVYVGALQDKGSAFDPAYLSQLDMILHYDLNYNGSTQVMARSAEKEQMLHVETGLSSQGWKSFGAPYILTGCVEGKALRLSVFTTETGSLKQFPPISLTGDVTRDRSQIHQLADGICKALFQREGVANSRILYAFQMKNPRPDGSEWLSEIWECDWDGANPRQITHEGSYCVSPVLVPHHTTYANDRFLYVSYKHGQPKIYIASLLNATGRRLISLSGNQLLPTLSMQRDKIAFICDAGGRADLFLQPLNPETGEVGKPIQLFSYPRSTQASPTFSPDGSKIAFASDKDGGIRIYVIPTASKGQRAAAQMITKQNRENSCPSWSPDGAKLAYSAKTNGIRQIWIYDFRTREEMQLTSGPGNKENPCWAPDSTHLVFNSTDHALSELYVVNLNQPEAIKISHGPGKKHYPTWGSR